MIAHCPCCGGKGRYVENAPDGGHFIECTQCWLSTRIIYPNKCDPRPELEDLWNYRVLERKLSELIARWKYTSERRRVFSKQYPMTSELHTHYLAEAKRLDDCVHDLALVFEIVAKKQP